MPIVEKTSWICPFIFLILAVVVPILFWIFIVKPKPLYHNSQIRRYKMQRNKHGNKTKTFGIYVEKPSVSNLEWYWFERHQRVEWYWYVMIFLYIVILFIIFDKICKHGVDRFLYASWFPWDIY